MRRAHRRHRLESYLKRLYGYAYSLTHDEDRSQDLVHDTVVKALAARRVPLDEPAYRAWLFTILRNVIIDQTRQPMKQECAFVDAELELESGWNSWSETRQVNALTVRIAFARLPVNHREILAAIDIAGLTYSEASKLFDVPAGTVMSRISRARSALYKHVQETTAEGKIEFLAVRKTGAR